MFEIDQGYSIESDLSQITDNYEILHFDEFPILFTGTNEYGNKIVGSFVEEDEDIFRYFIKIVNDRVYINFFNGEIPYLDLLNSTKDVFVVDKDINNIVV